MNVIELDAATVLLQWSVGGMLGCWFTTRQREVGVGYGWLLRIIYFLMAGAAAWIGIVGDGGTATRVRDAAAIAVAVCCASGFVLSFVRRREGSATFPVILDLIPFVLGTAGLVAAGVDAGGADGTAIARTLVGAVFLGFVSDAMLLGHWYLVQPGLPRRLLNEIVRSLIWLWPFEVAVMLLPTGMVSVIKGTVDDGWNGTLGWMWLACSIATIALVFVTQAALREKYYSAVMAATGLLYLAILTSFGMDLVARAVLS